jgi:transposase
MLGERARSAELLNWIFYVLWTGCQWKALPKDLPPKSTVHDYSNSGIGTARWSMFIMRSTWRCASRRDGKQARRTNFCVDQPQPPLGS